MSRAAPFERILRPLYEARAVVAWLIAGVWCLGVGITFDFGRLTVFLLVLLCMSLGLLRFSAAYSLARRKLALMGKPIGVIAAQKLMRSLRDMGPNIWLGWGFQWEPHHTQRAHEALKYASDDIYPPRWVMRLLGDNRDPKSEKGFQWVHGLEPTERDIFAPIEDLKGHSAVIAITGAMKTRLMSILVLQLVARRHTVVIYDPKNDHVLREIAKACTAAVGEPERFLMLHPARASESTRMDLLKNWDRVSQVASRVSLVLSAQEESTFKEFCWNAVHSITNGMKYIGRRVSIATLKTAMQSRVSVERLTEEALGKFFREEAPSLSDRIKEEIAAKGFKGGGRGKPTFVVETNSDELSAMIQVFNKDLAEDQTEARKRGIPVKREEIKGLVAILEANKEWFGKMIVSIMPMLTKLSTDDLRALLSPDYEDVTDKRPIMDMMRVVTGRHVLYIGTDNLADPSVGHALAAMTLADLSGVAAEIYNHGIEGDSDGEERFIHVIVDEWGDVMCEPLIQLANKGRGAGIIIWAFGQTYSDLVDALGGNDAKARRFMGNMNNLFVGAVKDTLTVKMVSEMFGTTKIDVRSQSQSTGSRSEDTGLEFSVNRGETIKEQDTELIPPTILGKLPNLQYLAMINRSEVIKGRIPVLNLG